MGNCLPACLPDGYLSVWCTITPPTNRPPTSPYNAKSMPAVPAWISTHSELENRSESADRRVLLDRLPGLDCLSNPLPERVPDRTGTASKASYLLASVRRRTTTYVLLRRDWEESAQSDGVRRALKQ